MDMTDQLGMLIILTFEDFDRRMTQEFQNYRSGDRRISDRHRSIFMHLGRFGSTRSVDLARAIGIRKQSMMKLVHELEDMRLITRHTDPSDARAKLIELTPAGEKLMAKYVEATNQILEHYADIVGKQKLKQLASTLAALNGISGKSG